MELVSKWFLRTARSIPTTLLSLFLVERSDSGVSESHSRQSSEPFTGSSEEPEDRSRELLDVCDKRREWVEESQMQNIEEQIREQEVGVK